MLKEHKEKISKALDVTSSSFSESLKPLKDYNSSMYEKTLKNTVIAGGVFRSIFTDTPINDVDIFFTDKKVAMEFRDFFLRNHYFSKVTSNYSFEWILSNKTKVSFITDWADEPLQLINRFDFTFNKHFYSPWTGQMYFDVDTFHKIGYPMLGSGHQKVETSLVRVFKFLRQGFNIPDAEILNMVSELATKHTKTTMPNLATILQTTMTSGGLVRHTPPRFSGEVYTEQDYYGSVKTPKEAKINGIYVHTGGGGGGNLTYTIDTGTWTTEDTTTVTQIAGVF